MTYTENVICQSCGREIIIVISYIDVSNDKEKIFHKDKLIPFAQCQHDNSDLIKKIDEHYSQQIVKPNY